jgi:hypothetical protein
MIMMVSMVCQPMLLGANLTPSIPPTTKLKLRIDLYPQHYGVALR